MGRAQERSRDGRGPNRSYAGVNRIRFEGCILSPVAVPDRSRTPQFFQNIVELCGSTEGLFPWISENGRLRRFLIRGPSRVRNAQSGTRGRSRGGPDCGAATRRYSSFSAGPHFSVASDPTEDGLGVLGSRRSGSGVLGSRRVGFGTRVGREGWRCGVRWGCRCGWRRGVRRRRGEAGVEVRERASVMTGGRIFRPDSIGPMCTSTPLSCWTCVA